MDSAIEPGIIALFEDGRVKEILHQNTKDPSFPFQGIDLLLEKAQLDKKDIHALSVGVGPGSYTGIRSSVAVCQALSFAKGLPLIPVPSLFRFLPSNEGLYRVAIDARMGGVFSLLARVKNSLIDPHYTVEKIALEKLVPTASEEGAKLLVDEKVHARLHAHMGDAKTFLVSDSLDPLAHHVFRCYSTKDYLVGQTPSLFYLGSQQGY